MKVDTFPARIYNTIGGQGRESGVFAVLSLVCRCDGKITGSRRKRIFDSLAEEEAPAGMKKAFAAPNTKERIK